MDIQYQYLDIQLYHKRLIYCVVISKILILTYFTILDIKAEYLDIKAEYLDITEEYLDITTEYIRCLSYS